MRQIHNWVKLCSLCVTKKTAWSSSIRKEERHNSQLPAVTTRSEVGELELETHLGYPCLLTGVTFVSLRHHQGPFLMKPDYLFCSASPLILSTGALYNSLMLIVANKSTFLAPLLFLLRPQSLTRAWSMPGTSWIAARECNKRSRVVDTHSC